MGDIQPVYPSKPRTAERSGAMENQPAQGPIASYVAPAAPASTGSDPAPTAPINTKPKPRKKIFFLILILLVLSTLIGGYLYWSKTQKPESEEQRMSETREGKFISINFGHYNPGALIPYAGITDEAEREKRLKAEREYADNLAQSIYSDLKSGSLTFEAAIEKTLSDPKVGAKSAYQTSLQSGSFSAQDYTEKKGLLHGDFVREKIDTTPVGQFSEPFVQQVDVSFCEGPDCISEYVDTRWLIIKIEKANQ